MKLPALHIGDLIAPLPIIQGGMGIGVSRAGLAAAVANQGGVGILSGVQMGFLEPDFKMHPLQANLRAMAAEIRKARSLSPKGIIGINFLMAMNHYKEIALAAVNEGIDLIVSGAGLPSELPSFVEGSKTRIAPIVSSAKAAQVITKLWERNYNRTPDLVIVEGPQAGGHLGFSPETLRGPKMPNLLDLVKEVMEALSPYAQRAAKPIPVVAAGGIFTGADIAQCISAGASGVQMATRFVATEECDADMQYKQAYLDAKQEDIVIIDSPVGMPGRALNNRFIRNLAAHTSEPISGCYLCLKGCNPTVAPYCISDALINAAKGDVDGGVVFVGSNAWRLNEITTVKRLMNELACDAQLALDRVE
jgi:nitronate monooxygenase